MRRLELFYGLALISASLFFYGCNMTGGIDSPKSDEELVVDAQARIESGDCDGAVDKLNQITSKSSHANQVLGWAHLCRASATINKVGSALFAYNSNNNNLAVVGTLANALIPSNDGVAAKVDQAIAAFNAMQAGDEKQLSIAFAQVVKAAVVIAKSSGDGVSVKRADVSVNACLNAVCTAGGAACTVTAANTMTGPDATTVGNALQAAQTAANGASSIGSAKNLVNNLFNGSDLSITGIRCLVFNSMLSQ